MKSNVIQKNVVFLLFMCCFFWSYAQKSKVILTGHVYDETSFPLAGVNVKVLHTYYGAITDSKGAFKLECEIEEGMIIEFSFIGMKRETVTYKGDNQFEIMLKEDTHSVDEVVVTANSNINAIDLRSKAGVVQQVDMKRINEKPMIDMGLALQGSIPGLVVVNTGDLGSDPEIRIRGNSSLRKGNTTNEPLYVMDGQVISSETFYNLNPMDIKDIKVLKDAAACALYGTKAANGVLEITSQRGISGSPVVTYSMDIGVTTRGRRGIKMMDSKEKLELERLLKATNTPGYLYSADYYNKYYADDPKLDQLIAEGQAKIDSLGNINTDWFNKLIRNNFYQKHNISLRGGSENTTYYVSINYTEQGGRIEGNDKRRTSIRLNLDQKLGSLGYAMLSVNGGYTRTNSPNGTSNDPTSLVYQLNPYEQDDNTELWSYPGRSYNDLMHQYSQTSNSKTAGISGSLTLNPFVGFDIAAVAGLDFLLDESVRFTPGSSYSEITSGKPENAWGEYAKDKNTTLNISSNIRITYNRVFAGKHDLTLGANMDYYQTVYDNVGIVGYGVGDINSANAINQSLTGNWQPKVSGLKDKNAQIGFGGVFGYTFDNTYDIYGTYKIDASSLLPKDKRWNSAWAVGIGWTPSNYAFLEDNSVITRLNFKASYGKTANLNGVSTSATVATFQYMTDRYESQRPLQLIMMPNENLKPEQNISIDAGMTLELFERVTFDIAWYKRRTEDALLDVPIPSSTGFSVLKRNIGILENRGIELGVNVKLLDTDDWRLNIAASMAYNQNKVIDLYYADKIYASEDALIPDYEVGKSYDMLYGPISLGINPLTGYPVFLDSKGKEKQGTEPLTIDDMVALGHSTPPYTGSISLSASYKSFDLDMDFYYVHGGIQRFNNSYVRGATDGNYNAVKGQTEKMWFKPGDEGKVYSTPFFENSTAEDNLYLYANSLTVGKSDYLKLSMVSLRYRVPYRFLQKNIPFVKYATLALQGSNLFTWTSYKESDPESGTLAGTMQPVYTFNLNLTF